NTSQVPLSALLRHSITLNQVQELALQRLQQGEHTPLSERRIRVL
ncbi:MAG: T3SS regulon translocated regulator ExsE family protein, partial [Aeromonas veronii]